MAIIRVSGYPGSGKTTLCKRLAAHLRYEHHYAGGIFRAMAKERGLSIEAFYEQVAKDPSLEQSVDEKQAELMQTFDNLVMEGRMAPFQKTPFKTINVLLTVDPDVGAKRELEREENRGRSVAEMRELATKRIETERSHYRDLYKVPNHLDPEHFDIVLDTSGLSKDEVFTEIMHGLKL